MSTIYAILKEFVILSYYLIYPRYNTNYRFVYYVELWIY